MSNSPGGFYKRPPNNSEAGKDSAVKGTTLSKYSKPSGKSGSNGEQSSTGTGIFNASESSTHLISKQDQEEKAKVVVQKTSKVIKTVRYFSFLLLARILDATPNPYRESYL